MQEVFPLLGGMPSSLRLGVSEGLAMMCACRQDEWRTCHGRVGALQIIARNTHKTTRAQNSSLDRHPAVLFMGGLLAGGAPTFHVTRVEPRLSGSPKPPPPAGHYRGLAGAAFAPPSTRSPDCTSLILTQRLALMRPAAHEAHGCPAATLFLVLPPFPNEAQRSACADSPSGEGMLLLRQPH